MPSDSTDPVLAKLRWSGTLGLLKHDKGLWWVATDGWRSLRQYLDTGPDSNPEPAHAERLVLESEAAERVRVVRTELQAEIERLRSDAGTWQRLAEQWERDHQNMVLPYTSKLEDRIRTAMSCSEDESLSRVDRLVRMRTILRGDGQDDECAVCFMPRHMHREPAAGKVAHDFREERQVRAHCKTCDMPVCAVGAEDPCPGCCECVGRCIGEEIPDPWANPAPSTWVEELPLPDRQRRELLVCPHEDCAHPLASLGDDDCGNHEEDMT